MLAVLRELPQALTDGRTARWGGRGRLAWAAACLAWEALMAP